MYRESERLKRYKDQDKDKEQKLENDRALPVMEWHGRGCRGVYLSGVEVPGGGSPSPFPSPSWLVFLSYFLFYFAMFYCSSPCDILLVDRRYLPSFCLLRGRYKAS